jgi:hypothetical protein
MDLAAIVHDWQDKGFVVLPGYLPDEVLGPAVAELGLMFPSPGEFHGGDPRRERFLGDEFAGIERFPFASNKIGLLAVHDLLIDLAKALLGDDDLRLYSAEAWAKYTGAADYDQDLHRDYLNHTVVVPSEALRYRQVEMFVYLVDVPEDLGPPHLVPGTHTAGIAARPNWFPRSGAPGEADPGLGRTDEVVEFVASGRSRLYDHEVSAAGPAGTVVAFELGTFHRGTGMTRPGGARYTMHLGYRRAEAEWGQRRGWAECSHEPAWYRFVDSATPGQLELFGFPPPGHPFWTADTLAGVASRYPGLDLSPWRDHLA